MNVLSRFTSSCDDASVFAIASCDSRTVATRFFIISSVLVFVCLTAGLVQLERCRDDGRPSASIWATMVALCTERGPTLSEGVAKSHTLLGCVVAPLNDAYGSQAGMLVCYTTLARTACLFNISIARATGY